MRFIQSPEGRKRELAPIEERNRGKFPPRSILPPQRQAAQSGLWLYAALARNVFSSDSRIRSISSRIVTSSAFLAIPST